MDEQEELQRLAFEKCSVALVNKLDVSAILPHLIACHLLTDQNKQELTMHANTNRDKAQYLLDIIPRKAKGWFELFLECLRESTSGTGHRDLVKELEMRLQEVTEQGIKKSKELGSKQSSVKESRQPVGAGQTDEREDVRKYACKLCIVSVLGNYKIEILVWHCQLF